MIAAGTDVRISSDVVLSTNPHILSGWQDSSDQLFIWRRPDFDAAAMQNCVDEMARADARRMDLLRGLRLRFFPEKMHLEPVSSMDAENLLEMDLPTDQLQGFGEIFPRPGARLLVEDIERCLPLAAREAFPGKTELRLLFRTQADGVPAGLHIDARPVLGFCYGAGTEYLLSNNDWPRDRPVVSRRFVMSAEEVVAERMSAMEPGDVSLMKDKPHRTPAKDFQPRLWLGLSVPA